LKKFDYKKKKQITLMDSNVSTPFVMDVLIIPLAFISARKIDSFLYRDFFTSTFLPGGQAANR